MSRRHRQLRVRDPDAFLLLSTTPLAHRHARILRTIPVDHTIICFTYPDLHHGLLGTTPSKKRVQRICRAISDETGRDKVWQDSKTVVDRLNRMLIGWANYFCLGSVR